VSHLANPKPLIDVDQVNREFHKESVDGFAGLNPESFAGVQTLMLEQAGTPLGAGVRHIGGFRQDGLPRLVPNHDFQTRRI
jgi:hypothetical protein